MEVVKVARNSQAARVMFIKEFMGEIQAGIGHRKVNSAAVPEEFALLRTLQFAAQYW